MPKVLRVSFRMLFNISLRTPYTIRRKTEGREG
jgi:hypothetical protein